MNLQDVLAEERNIWGSKKQSLEHITVCMGKNYGDICKQARAKLEKGQADNKELKKELGNMITSTIRWADDLGFGIEECVQLALTSQKTYKPGQ